MHEVKIVVILSGLQGQNSEELREKAEQLLRLNHPEYMLIQVLAALPDQTDFPQVNNNSIAYCHAQDEQTLYYELPRQLDADFVTFMEPEWDFSENIWDELAKTILTYPHREIFVCEIQGEGAKAPYTLLSTFRLKKRRLREISVVREPSRLWVNPAGAFFDLHLWKRLPALGVDLRYYIPNLFLLQTEALAGTFTLITSATITLPDTLEDVPKGKLCYFDQACYFDLLAAFEYLFRWLGQDGYLPDYFQYAFFYFLSRTFEVNRGPTHLHQLVGDSLDRFYQRIAEVLVYVDDRIILDNSCRSAKMNGSVRYAFLRWKYHEQDRKHEYWCTSNEVTLVFHGRKIFCVSGRDLVLQAGELTQNVLHLSGVFPFPMDTDRFKIIAEFGGQSYPVETSKRYASYKEFGEVFFDNYCFDVSIPLALGKGDIRFYLVGDGARVNLRLDFAKARSLLNNKGGYYAKGKFLLYQQPRRIAVRKNRKRRRLRRECKILREIVRNRNWEALMVRVAYLLTRPFLRKKQIWIFFDKNYKAGDNGEYLYRYCRQQKDGVKKYYVLRNDVPDSQRFKAEGLPYLRYGSLRHRVLFLNASVVFATHVGVHSFSTFKPEMEVFFRDLFRYKLVCIQHGLTVQNIPHYQNRVMDRTDLYMLASPAEWNTLSSPEYDYAGRNILRKTGLARYDGLVDQHEKIILITPTWRNYLAIPSEMGHARGYNNHFRESDYFKIYNSLINNPKLLDAAKRYGYRIMYLLHPVTSAQKEDYGTNEFVDIVASTDDFSYEETMTRAALMVTDYSGVQFDFAYMYKPVVYYHPDALPPSYEEGEGYHMATDALGEIVSKEDELVDLLVQYMEEDCQMHPEYRKRVDDFFYYHDHNNCQRIYDEVRRWQEQNN